MFFPVKFCGVWTLIISGDPRVPINSQLYIDYNDITLSTNYDYGPIKCTNQNHGVICKFKNIKREFVCTDAICNTDIVPEIENYETNFYNNNYNNYYSINNNDNNYEYDVPNKMYDMNDNKYNANFIIKKDRYVKVNTRVFPPIELYYPRTKMKGIRLLCELDKQEHWLTVKSKGHEYIFRKSSCNSNTEDFPAFHKMLITQLAFTELINHFVNYLKI